MATLELLIGGFGGQGVILSGQVVGRAAALYDGKHSTMTQAFGPEARGSACSAQVVLSDTPVLYPYVRSPAILVVMSQEAYTKFSPRLAPDGILLYESDLVHLGEVPPGVRRASVPSTRIAEELGRTLVSNIVMTGFLAAATGVVSKDAARKAVVDSVPPGTERLNLTAFEKGFSHGQSATLHH